MPLYEFEYTDADGEVYRFQEMIPLAEHERLSNMTSPCGEFAARRVYDATPTHKGMTVAAKNLGVPKRRIEFGAYAANERAKRKKDWGPGTRPGDSNEYWTGTEDLKNVISPKTKQVTKAPVQK